ncbi:MAG: hypothetical protein V7731_16215 [Amphritea sp.]
MITLLENIHTIKATDRELRAMMNAIEAGLAAQPQRFPGEMKQILEQFCDDANKKLN